MIQWVAAGAAAVGAVSSIIGGNKAKKKAKEAGKAKNLLYLRPYKENNVEIKVWETEVQNERYGLPRIYTLTASTTEGTTKPIKFD